MSYLPICASSNKSIHTLKVVRDSAGAVITCVGGPIVRGLSSACPRLGFFFGALGILPKKI